MFAENAPGGYETQWMCITAPNFNGCGLTTNKKTPENEKLHSTKEIPIGFLGASSAASYLGCTTKHLQYHFSKGHIKATRFGRNWYWHKKDLDAFCFGA